MTTQYTINRYNAANGSFDLGSVSLIRTHTLGYVRCGRSGNMIVTFCNPAIPARLRAHRQQLVILPAAFYRIMSDVNRNSIAGCAEATPDQLRNLGFFVSSREEAAEYDTRIAIFA